MLEIKNVTKVYNTEGFSQKALDNISLNFRKCEFASILGPSGSGKTTFLNIIGGLDHYTSGDIIINEVSTKKYKDAQWDSYRNHRIGFVFQNYNLITHQNILANVKIALTLSGVSKKEATLKAKKVLKEVGLEKHMYKKPNQLSGGQMQRVAIARALINDPDILLADEPTGALDSQTSIQIMDILKNVAKEKLVIMVTHNPELAKEYSTRIITLKDGHIISDTNPYDGKINTKEKHEEALDKSKKVKMSFKTALGLSFNNLMTKKWRTLLIAMAGSIGIIGIALILAVSTGFQNYVDSIGEETLSSYPFTIMDESSDIASLLLSMTSEGGTSEKSDTITEKQYISSMLSSVSTNDIKDFKKYFENNYGKVKKDLRNVKYNYSIDPLIYTYDVTGKLAKLNPSNLFTSLYGSSSMMSSYSSYTSIFSQMVDDEDKINKDYNILAGRLPNKYNEIIIVLPEANTISDLLVYSLGLRDNDELTKMVSSIMNGETISNINEPLTLTYNDLLNVDLRVIMPSDLYKYNSKYDIYEDMTDDAKYLKNLYDKAEKLKVVGILSPKKGVTTLTLNSGVNYTQDLTKHIINYNAKSAIVQKQLSNENINIFTGKSFDSKEKHLDFSFEDLLSIDANKLKNAFNIDVNNDTINKYMQENIMDINNSIKIDPDSAKVKFTENLITLLDDIKGKMDTLYLNDIELFVNNYLNNTAFVNAVSSLESEFVISKDVFSDIYKGLIKSFLNAYVTSYYAFDNSLTTNTDNPGAIYDESIYNTVIETFMNNEAIIESFDKISYTMNEAIIKKMVMEKVTTLTSNLISNMASSFKIDEQKIASAFTLNLNEEEIMRIISAMTNDSKTTYKSNLISLGYQDLESPTSMSFYFSSFDGKDNFIKFVDDYNDSMPEEKVIKYSDTTGILISSVKTIVNAVSYVLIAFVSISLVVSSIMIGVITYISVYERTKEIGILRSIGASKHNISSIFNAETFIIGMLSGLFGIGVSYALIPVINSILHHFIGDINLYAHLNIKDGLVLILLSIILTIIGGLIPAKSASKKDPVEALRSE